MAGTKWRLTFAVVSAGLSAFQHGYNSAAVRSMTNITNWLHFDATDVQDRDGEKYFRLWYMTVSIFGFGGIIGAMFTALVADRFGRKLGLLLVNIFVFAGALLEGFSQSAHSAIMLILGRFLIGLSSGLVSGLAPMYLAEISPVSHRGCISTVYSLVLYISILLPGVVDFYQVWPWRLAATAVPALLQCLTLPFCPESPKFLLLNRGQGLRAQKALYWLQGDVAVHGDTETAPVNCSLEPFEADMTTESRKVTVLELVRKRQLRRPLLVAVAVMVAQQLTGIYTVTFIADEAFKLASLMKLNIDHVYLTIVATTVVSMFLVDRVGRRVLLLTGFSGMFLVTILHLVSRIYFDLEWMRYACAALLFLFAVMYALGPASIPCFLVHELFDQPSRATAASVVVTINWISYFVFTQNIDPFHIRLGHIHALWVYIVLQVISVVFIYFKVPETKKKTEEEISALFK